MTTEKRTSEQGHEFSVTIIRKFLLDVLSHDAVTDAVDAMLFEHVVENRLHPSVITENLRPLISEVLDTATLEDWQYVSGTLIDEARDVLRGDSVSDPNEQQAPDAGKLREELGQLRTQGLFSPSKARQAWKLVREIRRLTGVSLEKILADARADAEAARRRDEYYSAEASRGSEQAPAPINQPEADAQAPIVVMQLALRRIMDDGVYVRIEHAGGNEVEGWVNGLTEEEVSVQEPLTSQVIYIPLAEIVSVTELAGSVRPVTQEEALALREQGNSSVSSTRKRAGIILASNHGLTVAEIAKAQETDERYVRQVIADFNEQGLESLE